MNGSKIFYFKLHKNIFYSLTQNFEDIERIYKMLFSKPINNGLLQIFIAIYLFFSITEILA